MPNSITLNGQTLLHPGGLSSVDARSLTPIGATSTGIIGLIGEADGGTPNTVITIDDPALAKATFRSGPLADAIRIAFDPSTDPRIPGGAFRVICYKTNQSTQGSSQIPGASALLSETTTGVSTTTAINGTAVGVTLNQHANRWLKIGSEKRRIVSNTASPSPVYTVSPGFTTAPPAATAFSILQSQMVVTSIDYGTPTNQIAVEVEPGVTSGTYVLTISPPTGSTSKVEQSGELGGNAFLELMYKGGPVPNQGAGLTPAQGLPITAATTSTVTVTFTTAPTANQYDNMLLEFSDGKRRKIASHTVGLSVVFTLDPSTLLTAAEATASVGETATIRNVTASTASIVGSNGVATQLTSTVTPTADNLSIIFPANQTLKQFVDQINATTNYIAAVPAGVNGDTTLMKSFDFGTRNTAVDVRFDHAISYTSKGTFRRDLQAIVDWINTFSEVITAVKATAGTSEGSEPPDVTGGVVATVGDSAIYLIGGTRGTSANSNWQTAFDTLLQIRMNHVVPLISQDLINEGYGSTATFSSVAAQLSAHIGLAQGIGRNEQGGYMGMKATRAQYIAQLRLFNNTDIQLCAQYPTVLDVDGNLKNQPAWALAVMAAGMRSGAPEVGEPLTFKALKLFGLTQDTSWDPNSITDSNALLTNGALFVEQNAAGVFRWVRDLTTYLLDDNIVFTDGNMREEVRFLTYDLRTGLEDAFTGLKAKPATVANMRVFVSGKMALYKANGLITPSLDESGILVPDGFRRLRIFVDGNIATIEVEIYPVAGIVFQITKISLQLPRLVG